jgi:hypothetical protein
VVVKKDTAEVKEVKGVADKDQRVWINPKNAVGIVIARFGTTLGVRS